MEQGPLNEEVGNQLGTNADSANTDLNAAHTPLQPDDRVHAEDAYTNTDTEDLGADNVGPFSRSTRHLLI